MREWLAHFGKKFRQELPTKTMELAMTVVGLLIALLINGWVEDRNDRDTYRSMLAAIRSEARKLLETIR